MDDDGSEPRRMRKKMKTHFQLEILEKTYAVEAYPSQQHRAKLSVQLNLTNGQLKKWFSNRRAKDRKIPNSSNSNKIGYNMDKRKESERAWSYPNNCIPKKKRSQKPKISCIMSKTKERAWKNTNTQIPNKKLKSLHKLLGEDDDSDVEELLDPKHSGLVENVSSMLDSLLDDDDDDDNDDDVELSTTKQEHRELVENLSHMSDSLEKNSSCQSDMVCVQGYKVKRSIATILEAIFKKHGDIAANCVFKTSSTRTHFLEVVCEVVRRIQTDDMTEMVEDIECQVSDAEAANINVSWIRAHFEAFHKRKETSEKCSLLMEMESNTILVKEAAQMDLRERCAELMSAQERFKNAERCVRVLHLVEKNLHDNILESKSKLDSWVDHPVV